MEQAEYKQLLRGLEGLTAAQLDELLFSLQERKSEDDLRRLVHGRMADHRCCPHCESDQVVRHGFTKGGQRYQCKDCRKTFTGLTGTPFNHLQEKELMLAYSGCMADGLSLRKTAAKVGITLDRAFRWRHKFLAFLANQKPQALTGGVEADETFFPVSYKGQRKGLPRASKKRPGKTKDGEGAEKTKVVVAVQRGTKVAFDQILPDGTAIALTEALRPALGADAVLSTDGNASYWTVAKELDVESGSFVSSFHGKGGDGVWHVQSVNRYDADLKTWMSRFKGVATKYLANYLGWRRLIDRLADAVTPQQFMFHAIRTSYN